LIADINSDPSIEFTVHIGDIKAAIHSAQTMST